jgi:hypothetical protein
MFSASINDSSASAMTKYSCDFGVNEAEEFQILILKNSLPQVSDLECTYGFSEYSDDIVPTNKVWHNRKTKTTMQ